MYPFYCSNLDRPPGLFPAFTIYIVSGTQISFVIKAIHSIFWGFSPLKLTHSLSLIFLCILRLIGLELPGGLGVKNLASSLLWLSSIPSLRTSACPDEVKKKKKKRKSAQGSTAGTWSREPAFPQHMAHDTSWTTSLVSELSGRGACLAAHGKCPSPLTGALGSRGPGTADVSLPGVEVSVSLGWKTLSPRQ